MENVEARGRVHGDDIEAGSWKMDGTLMWVGDGRKGRDQVRQGFSTSTL